MALIEWTQEFEVCNEEIDEQHKQIIGLYNDLYTAMSKGDAQAVLSTILEELINYSLYHFETEEKYMNNSTFPNTKAHLKIHKQFCDKVVLFKKKYDSGEELLSLEIMDYLKSWISDHILIEDKKFSMYF